jgi:pimeloyl-ACP methyl ester carboxylesterase
MKVRLGRLFLLLLLLTSCTTMPARESSPHFSLRAKRALLGRSDDLLRPEVYLVAPYDPNRRIVVLIHGLASSPDTWEDLVDGLMGDEEIRQRYQIWLVFYRTSAPIAYSRQAIRQALDETLASFDPGRTAAASQGMVLVGHSMGGVLARLLVVDSGDRLWTALLGHPPQAAERQQMAMLAPYLDLKPMPEVSRAVFIASPHRGAPMASGRIGRIAARLVHLPAALVGTLRQAADALLNDQPAAAAQLSRTPDGIDGLSDRFPFRQVTSDLPIAPWVTYHSIIGCAKPHSTSATCNDGLVPYSSAHLEGAASELTVRSGHSVQKTPEAVRELRRILRLP